MVVRKGRCLFKAFGVVTWLHKSAHVTKPRVHARLDACLCTRHFKNIRFFRCYPLVHVWLLLATSSLRHTLLLYLQ